MNHKESSLKDSKLDFSLKLIPGFDIDESELSDEIVMIWDTTNLITSYNLITKQVKKESVENLPFGSFLENNRFLNCPQKVYISGGVVEGRKLTNLFFVLERKSNNIKRLQEMPIAVTRHSLINLYSRTLVLVGGKNNMGCYFYNVPKDQWELFNSINYEREDASLLFYNDILFLFGGILDIKASFLNIIIEYTHLDERRNSLWKVLDVSVNVPENNLSDLKRLSGCGVISSELIKNRVIICGGYNNENSDEVNYVYELTIAEENSEFFKRNDLHICIPNWFQESNFVSLQNKFYNFDIDGNLHSFSLDMEKFFVQEYKF